MIATPPPVGLDPAVWDAMSDPERAEFMTLAEDADVAGQWGEACADEPLDWLPLYRAIRAMGGINGLGQIAQHDIPGGLGTARDARGRLLPLRAAVAYDELPLALAAAGFGDWFADMTGDALLEHLWRAWDAWDAQQHMPHAARSDVVPDTAPLVPEPVRDVAPPLPEPDAADVDAYDVADAFGAIGETPRRAVPSVVRVRPAPRVRRVPDHVQRDRDEMLALEDAWAELERERTVQAGRDRASRTAQRSRLHVVQPEPIAPPSRRAHAIMVAAIVATFATATALLVALVASILGASVPGIVWPLALSLPAVGAGVLPVVLRPWALPMVRIRVAVSVERPAWRKAA